MVRWIASFCDFRICLEKSILKTPILEMGFHPTCGMMPGEFLGMYINLTAVIIR